MSRDLISVRAGARRVDVSISDSTEACTIRDLDWGNPAQQPSLADGADGGVRNGPSDWETSRSMSFDVDCIKGNVPGDASGLAVNRTSGRTPVTGTVVSGTGVALFTDPDVSDGLPSAVDIAADVFCSTATTAYLEILRGGTAVVSVGFPLIAGKWRRIAVTGASTAGSGSTQFRVTFNLPSGGSFSARRPVFGVGLGSVYHDQYTPGATLLAGGRVSRPANGTAWANAWLAGLSEACGAVATDPASTLVRSGDQLPTTLTFELHAAQAAGPQDGQHQMGNGTAKITSTAKPPAL
ncbi:MAG: hypothetical protein AAGC46_20265, partial [Solirubrobacteraceae bacterium]